MLLVFAVRSHQHFIFEGSDAAHCNVGLTFDIRAVIRLQLNARYILFDRPSGIEVTFKLAAATRPPPTGRQMASASARNLLRERLQIGDDIQTGSLIRQLEGHLGIAGGLVCLALIGEILLQEYGRIGEVIL